MSLPRRTLLAAAVVLPVAVPLAACERTPPPMGDDDVEITAVLALSRDDLQPGRAWHGTIEGDGHVHGLDLDSAAVATLARTGRVVARSGPGDDDGHVHWVRVTAA